MADTFFKLTHYRILEFPEVMFTPADGTVLMKDGFLAVHLLQPSPLSRLEPTPLALGPEALAVLLGKIQVQLFGIYTNPYAEWREMLQHPRA